MRCGEVKGPGLSLSEAVDKPVKTRWMKMMLGPSPGGDAQWCLGLRWGQAGELQHTLEVIREGWRRVCPPFPGPTALMFVWKGSGRNLPS